MNGYENTTNYRRGMIVAISLNVLLAAALSAFWWHSRHSATSESSPAASPSMQMENGAPTMASPSATSTDSTASTAPENDVPLATVQLTPQRMQALE
jgi:hypothetical protein